MKIDAKDNFKSQQKVAFWGIVSEVPHIVLVLVFIVISGSLMLALDLVNSLSSIIQACILFFLSKKLQGDHRFKYDYGMGKIEAFGAFISSGFLYIGLAAILIASVRALVVLHVPHESLILAVFMKAFNVSADIFLMQSQKKTVKDTSSSFIKANMILHEKNLVFDLVALVTLLISFIFREVHAVAYLEPVICIFCVVYITYHSIKIMRGACRDLLDKTLDEETQFKILKCVSRIYDGIEEFHSIRTRRSGHIIYVDLLVTFDNSTPYSEQRKVYETFDKAVKEVLPNSVSSIIIGDN